MGVIFVILGFGGIASAWWLVNAIKEVPAPAIEIPRVLTAEVPPGLDRLEIAGLVGEKLAWSGEEKNEFASVYAQIHWDALNEYLPGVLSQKFGWNEQEQGVFLTSSTKYLDSKLDFLSTVYVPGAYTFLESTTKPQIANLLVNRVLQAANGNVELFIRDRLRESAILKVAEYVRSEVELLPDLVPLPAQDLTLEESGGRLLLRFSTTYFNQGRGPLELAADPETAGTAEDLERKVFQRIYRADSKFREEQIGEFLWHEEHLHYHFADFISYKLEAVDPAGPIPSQSNNESKATYCIRDVSSTNLELQNEAPEAKYPTCNREIQGVSVGWGDTYFYTYSGQFLDITGLASGVYRLSFLVNPENIFEESDTENNLSSALIEIDAENLTIKKLSESPETYPVIEHVYKEQPL